MTTHKNTESDLFSQTLRGWGEVMCQYHSVNCKGPFYIYNRRPKSSYTIGQIKCCEHKWPNVRLQSVHAFSTPKVLFEVKRPGEMIIKWIIISRSIGLDKHKEKGNMILKEVK